MTEENRLQRLLRLKKELKEPIKRKPQSRKPQDELPPRNEVQEQLDEMSCCDRVITLTTHEQQDVVSRLKKFTESGDMESGMALYSEYREAINDDIEDTEDDRLEAFWVSSDYLKKLQARKEQTEFWEGKRRD